MIFLLMTIAWWLNGHRNQKRESQASRSTEICKIEEIASYYWLFIFDLRLWRCFLYCASWDVDRRSSACLFLATILKNGKTTCQGTNSSEFQLPLEILSCSSSSPDTSIFSERFLFLPLFGFWVARISCVRCMVFHYTPQMITWSNGHQPGHHRHIPHSPRQYA